MAMGRRCRRISGRSGVGAAVVAKLILASFLIGALSACGGSAAAPSPPPPGDTVPPAVSVSSPNSGSTVSGTVAASAMASDNVGVVGVQFRLDGSDLGTEDLSAPFSISWDTTTASDGSHALTAVARDAAGNTAVSTAVDVTVSNGTSSDTTPPTVTVTSPLSGATVSGTITFSADASDNVAVAGVQFRVDGTDVGSEDITPPYQISLDTNNLTNAAHTLTAVARDTANNTATSAGVTVFVNNQGGSSTNVTINLQSAQTRQTWIAWCTEPGPAVEYGGTDVDPTTLSEIVDAYANDLGFNCFNWKPSLGSANGGNGFEPTNDNGDPFSFPAGWLTGTFYPQIEAPFFQGGDTFDAVAIFDDFIIPIRNKVLANGETFTLIVDIVGGRSEFQTHWKSPATDYEEEYAEFAVAMIQWLTDNYSFQPDYWTIPANEPDTTHYSTDNPPGEAIKMANALTARMVTAGWPTKTNHNEAVVPTESLNNNVQCTSDADCDVEAGLWSYHGYDYNGVLMPTAQELLDRNAIRTNAAAWGPGGAGVPTAMLEICCSAFVGGQDGSYSHGLQIARDIFWNMTEGDISLWMPLQVSTPCVNSTAGCPAGLGDPIVIERDTLDDWYKFPAYYALRQYGKWIRPGYVRVETSCTNCGTDPSTGLDVKTVAFQRPNGSYVIVVINDQSVSANVTLSGFPSGTYTIEGVDPSVCTDPPGGAGVRDRCTPTVYPSKSIASGGDLILDIPAQSIVTFY